MTSEFCLQKRRLLVSIAILLSFFPTCEPQPTNIQFEGMSNDATSVSLSGVAEAVEWTHVLEEGQPKRPTQRYIVYPPSLSHPAEVISSGTPGLDPEDGHPIAYQ
jgi:hypothetical protein